MEEIQEITSGELEKRIEKQEQVRIIDVREEQEVINGMIPEAEHIPMNEIPSKMDELDKDKEYILVCRSGRRSYNVAEYMQREGFKVKNLTGGMLDWDGEVMF